MCHLGRRGREGTRTKGLAHVDRVHLGDAAVGAERADHLVEALADHLEHVLVRALLAGDHRRRTCEHQEKPET